MSISCLYLFHNSNLFLTTLATITCILRNDKGDVLALGEHGKAAIPKSVAIGSKI